MENYTGKIITIVKGEWIAAKKKPPKVGDKRVSEGGFLISFGGKEDQVYAEIDKEYLVLNQVDNLCFCIQTDDQYTHLTPENIILDTEPKSVKSGKGYIDYKLHSLKFRQYANGVTLESYNDDRAKDIIQDFKECEYKIKLLTYAKEYT